MRLLTFLSIYIFSVTQTLAAEKCSAIFPDGASTHSADGTIFFGYNARLIGSDDNLLATTSIGKNGGSNVNTCNTADCVATGTPSETASSINFQSTVSATDVSLSYQDEVEIGGIDFPGNEFNNINPGSASEASIIFTSSHSEYFVNRLVLGFQNTLYLQAGATYWFDELSLGSQADIRVLGSGTATIYVNQSTSFPSPALINSPAINNSGDASKLVMYVFSDVTFNNNSTFSGSLYLEGDLILGSSSYAFGAVSAANIELGTESTITYQSDEIAETNYGNLCDLPQQQCEILAGSLQAIGIKIDSGGSNSQINTTTEALAIHSAWLDAGSPATGLISGGTYNVAASGSSKVDRIDFGGAEHDFTGTLPYPGLSNGVDGSDFLVHASGTLSLPAGTYTIFVESDDGFSFVMDTISGDTVSFNKFGSSNGGVSNELRFENPTANSNTGGSFTLSQDSVFDIAAIFFERGGGDYLEVSIASGIRSNNAPSGYEILREGALSGKVKLGACTTPALMEYRFEEGNWNGTADEIIDHSGNGHHGRVLANSTPELFSPALAGDPGTCGYASQNNGVIQVLGLPLDTSTVDVKTTVTFWMNWDGTNNVMPIGWDTHDIWIVSGSIGFNTGNSDVFGISSAGLANGWHHIAVEFTNGSVTNNRMHVDGVEQILTQRRSSPNNSRAFVDSELRIGGWSRGSNYEFHGLIDEVRVYQGALATAQVVDIMNERHECAVSALDHFEIQHDGQGFTCEAETLTIKACANADCDILYNQETSITLSPSGWSGGNTLVFTGEITTSLNVTDEGAITMAKSAANPDAELRCFNGDTETCEITFSNDGFEIYGATIGDSLPDQLAASNFSNVNLRAVRSVDNVCEALLEGTQEITLSYNCDSPDQCLTPLNSINIVGDGSGENSGNIEVEFNDQGIASLALLNYPDAGRLNLSVAAVIEGVTFDNSDQESVDIYPSYLDLNVTESELLYSGSGTQNNYVAGESFTVVIGAYGTNDNLLPNYQAENPQLKVRRVSPSSSGENGTFKYSDSGTKLANTSAAFTNTSGLSFSDGEHRYALANYTEVGRIEIDVQDADYLGNEITFDGEMTLGDFYPAYFDVALTEVPTLADTCNNIFSYLGQNINFETSPEFTLTAYNALGTKTLNYSDTYWNYQPNKPTVASLSFIDSSTFSADDSATVINLGDTPVIANNDNYDGSGTVTINNGSFRYNKVDPADQSIFAAVSPFDAKINLEFSSDFFNSSFVDQNGIQDIICYKAAHSDNTCLGWDINDVIGTQIRYGRLVLESTYGPETEPLNVPIKTEYFNASQWLLNTDDSNCTSIDFTEDNNEIQLSDTSFADSFNSVTSTGVLIKGVAVGNQFTLDAPNTTGELDIWLDPTALDVTWPAHLNYDWNGDGFINTDDFPEATVSFGLFRGNDRIIHWREVFN